MNMGIDQRPSKPQFITASQKNWINCVQGVDWQSSSEAPVYTDAYLIGEWRQEPYAFIHALPYPLTYSPAFRPVIFLRVAFHSGQFDGDRKDLFVEQTNDKIYHGGSIFDELVAIASVFLGVRLKAGEVSRTFLPNEDPLGRPQCEGYNPAFFGFRARDAKILPYLYEQKNVADIKPIEKLPCLSYAQASLFIQAARAYQEAIWVAEHQPELAWIMLVTAIETAAKDKGALGKVTVDHDLVEEDDIMRLLKRNHLDAKIVEEAAAIQSAKSMAQAKFIRFINQFCPDPPTFRPIEKHRFYYSQNQLRDALKKIYGYRSSALHRGIPFPKPMCIAPFIPLKIDERIIFEEIPAMNAMRTYGAQWHSRDCPMLLHTFEYIVRGCLINWWNGMSESR